MSAKKMWSNTTPFVNRPQEEKSAIVNYCETAHETNVPKDIDKAEWTFFQDADGKLDAGC